MQLESISAILRVLWLSGGFLLLLQLGCKDSLDQPTLGQVHGIVTLDGLPLPRANIAFRPLAGGRRATAVSAEDGTYELVYLAYPEIVLGTRTGENQVYISTYNAAANDYRPELVPDCYRTNNSILKVIVKRGSNEIDLHLKGHCPDVTTPTPENVDKPSPIPQPSLPSELPDGDIQHGT